MKGMQKLIAGMAISALLAACGGGGDGGTASPLSVGATSDGAKSTSVAAGQSASLTVESGKEVKLDANQAVTWTATPSKTTISSPAITEQSWRAALTSPEGGTVTLKAVSVSNPANSATITITVPPHRYAAIAPRVGEAITFNESNLQLNGTTVTKPLTYTTTAIANGIATLVATDATNTVVETYTQDGDRNRLTRSRPPGTNQCTYAPKRDLYNFPLYVGKTWSPAWTLNCALGYHETAAVNAVVEGFEQLSTPAGTLDTLRIRYVVAYTNSNDVNFTTYSENDVCWWSTKYGRAVKCQFDYTYPAGMADLTYKKTYTQVAASVSP
ncbi:hypothetical protein P3W83_14770 [Cupriavidus basilensis]|nr:hypothetical protein [Cupriavidus basilensis]